MCPSVSCRRKITIQREDLNSSPSSSTTQSPRSSVSSSVEWKYITPALYSSRHCHETQTEEPGAPASPDAVLGGAPTSILGHSREAKAEEGGATSQEKPELLAHGPPFQPRAAQQQPPLRGRKINFSLGECVLCT